jgi:membrane associated rhomboid family serine protease
VFPLRDNIPTDRTPVVTFALIVLNVLAYFLWQDGGILNGPTNGAHTVDWGVIPYEITHWGDECTLVQGGQALGCGPEAGDQPSTVVTLFTSMFMHGSILHLGGNMLFLWIFGNNIEDSMGGVRFALFYLLGGLAAIGLQTIVDPDAMVPTIGASGAVSAVLGAYILLYPRARVVTLVFFIIITIIELPAMVMLGIWIMQQVAFGAAEYTTGGEGSGGVAYFAHIGGFLFGLLVIKLLANRVKSVPPRYPVY